MSPEINTRGDRAWDLVPAGVAVFAGAIAIGYTRLMGAQGDSPRVWFLGGLITAAALAAYAAVSSVPRRAEAMAVSGAVLLSFGILGLASIGFPILIVGVLALAVAAALGAGTSSRTEVPISRNQDEGHPTGARSARPLAIT